MSPNSVQKPAIALALAIERLGAGCLALCYDGLVAALAVGLVSHHGKSGSSCPQPSAQYSALE